MLLAASAPRTQDASRVSIEDRRAVLEAAAKIIGDMYVFEDQAKTMVEALHANLERGAYDDLADGRAFAQRLTTDLRSICNDKHLAIEFNAEPISVPAAAESDDAASAKPTSDISPHRARMAQFNNYGIEKIERLQANVWLLQLNEFVPLELSRDAIT
ncbi:MAG TPA: hypothetical protein VFX76_04245, partial [Roseiflexaceae bacterium]|nr:hypothetical protein [Roseiflexaceae bacterium]